MGLYDGKLRPSIAFKFDFDWRKLKYPALGFAALLVVLFFAFSIALLLQPKAIEARLESNPLIRQNDFVKTTSMQVLMH